MSRRLSQVGQWNPGNRLRLLAKWRGDPPKKKDGSKSMRGANSRSVVVFIEKLGMVLLTTGISFSEHTMSPAKRQVDRLWTAITSSLSTARELNSPFRPSVKTDGLPLALG
jgi:hypothetical protein